MLPGCGHDPSARTEPHPAADASSFTGCPAEAARDIEGLHAESRKGLIDALLQSSDPIRPVKFENAWTLRLEASDEPLSDAEVTRVTTYMPLHGHDGRPPSEVRPTDAPGEFLGTIHFMMRGYWQVQLDVTSPSAGQDRLVFHVCVEE